MPRLRKTASHSPVPHPTSTIDTGRTRSRTIGAITSADRLDPCSITLKNSAVYLFMINWLDSTCPGNDQPSTVCLSALKPLLESNVPISLQGDRSTAAGRQPSCPIAVAFVDSQPGRIPDLV